MAATKYQSVWAAYRHRAKTRGYEWKLSRNEFDRLLQAPCYYCGRPPSNTETVVTAEGLRWKYNGIDRIDNKPIYSQETVVSCCAVCNSIKNKLPRKSFLDQVESIFFHRVVSERHQTKPRAK